MNRSKKNSLHRFLFYIKFTRTILLAKLMVKNVFSNATTYVLICK